MKGSMVCIEPKETVFIIEKKNFFVGFQTIFSELFACIIMHYHALTHTHTCLDNMSEVCVVHDNACSCMFLAENHDLSELLNLTEISTSKKYFPVFFFFSYFDI